MHDTLNKSACILITTLISSLPSPRHLIILPLPSVVKPTGPDVFSLPSLRILPPVTRVYVSLARPALPGQPALSMHLAVAKGTLVHITPLINTTPMPLHPPLTKVTLIRQTSLRPRVLPTPVHFLPT